MNRNGFDRGASSEHRPPLKFHSIHGQNIKREEGGCRVVRRGTFCNGIVFSNRPISIDERVGIRQTMISAKWSGVLRFGVTVVDPSQHRSLELPKYACPHLSEEPGYWIRALPDRYSKQGALVHFFVSRAGNLMYGIDGAIKGIFIDGIDTTRPLWVIVDVYGTATAVEFESLAHSPLVESIERQFESRVRVNSPPPPLSLPTRQPPSRRGGLSIFGFSLMGGGGEERRAVPATTGRVRGDTTLPPPPRMPAPETPVARPRLLIMSPPRQDRASARIDWGISDSTDSSSSRSSDVRPPVRTTSLVRQTPPTTATTSAMRGAGQRTSMVPRPTLTSSVGRALMEAPPTARVVPTSSASRAEPDGDIYRRIEQFSETTMRLVRDWAESAVAPLSPRRMPTAQPIPMETQTSSSSTARRSPPTMSVRRGATTTSSDGYLRLQMTSSSAARLRERAAAATAQNRSPPSMSSVRSPRVAATAQASSSSSSRRSDDAARRRSPLAAMSVQKKTSSATRDAVQKPSSSPSTARKDDYAGDCSICMEAGVNAVIYTCGHMCMCYECALKIKVQTGICPLCREPIKDVIRTYKS